MQRTDSWARMTQLIVSCIVLGIGVALLLLAALGSDGYSTFVNGISIALAVPFLAVNVVLGVILVALAWFRGLIPGLGTVVQPVVVGATVSALMFGGRPRPRRWPSTRPCRSVGVTRSSRVPGRWADGCWARRSVRGP